MPTILSLAAALTAALAAAQGGAPAGAEARPPAPLPVIYVVDGDYGAAGSPGNLRRLLDEWQRIGAIDARFAPPVPNLAASCTVAGPYKRLDEECVRRLYPQRPGEPPTVVIVTRDSGRVAPEHKVKCIGPSGVGGALVNMNSGGAFSSDPRQLSLIRADMASCIAAAQEGALARSIAVTLGFDIWGTGARGDFFYHRLTGDCGALQHRIGRNATRGSFIMKLSAVRWAYEPSAQVPKVRFDCLGGDCVDTYRTGASGKAASHRIAFEDAARARRFIATLDGLKQACARR
jgi:hypothetical protein